MNFLTILFTTLCLFISLSCNNDKNNASKSSFTSSDSTITVAQMKKWLRCNPHLDSLSYRYIDSLETEDPAIRRRHQNNFIRLQDSICIEQGLSGGYKEYVWILKISGQKQNRKVLDSLGIKKF